MSQTTLRAFEHTIEITHLWLIDILDRLAWTDQNRAYRALRAVLHALRDRLTVNDAAHLAAQLPMLIRGVYYEGYHPHDKPLRERSKQEFLEHVGNEFVDTEFDIERVTRAVLHVLAKHITSGEVDKIKQALPEGIRALWT
ncbi:MAG: DUF2267 domain-containing protein [Pirellulales bacterium]|nr:DUF2267 domain-containing protein [Pirellulales bacterium]